MKVKLIPCKPKLKEDDASSLIHVHALKMKTDKYGGLNVLAP